MPEHLKDEPGLTRRSVMRTAAWSVPVIAAAVATPMAAASEFAVTIVGVEYHQSSNRHVLRIEYANFDPTLAVQGRFMWAPSSSGFTDSDTFTPIPAGNLLLLANFTTGVTYTFFVTVYGGPAPIDVQFVHTF